MLTLLNYENAQRCSNEADNVYKYIYLFLSSGGLYRLLLADQKSRPSQERAIDSKRKAKDVQDKEILSDG